MTASDIVTVDVKVVAPKIEIINVEFSVVGSEGHYGIRRRVGEEILNI